MFLARIDGTVVPAAKHERWRAAASCSRNGWRPMAAAGAEPLVLIDWMGAANGATVLVSTDGDIARERFGNNTPARMVVAGIVDHVQIPEQQCEACMRLAIVRGHVTLCPAVPELMGKTLVVLEPVTMANLVARNGLGGGKVSRCRR